MDTGTRGFNRGWPIKDVKNDNKNKIEPSLCILIILIVLRFLFFRGHSFS